MLKKEQIIHFNQGLHLRPSNMIAYEARKFESDIRLSCNGKVADCKSALSLLQLGAQNGSTIGITVKGEDEAEAMNAILRILT
ncbi:HPr family phosphocarrier protein [Paenibacillus abyssi]|uniref:HPr domain-containing protein n=1 Tax=Paenibacillus abyssi TaxID=1340531 RepID=A0A917G028_9BACL|nr:HPr family phosphocarrier protein [Paenibacillus abyssi]GGG15952.1 hypothetical protein GCM10010916_36110 [Paenibacillus abyssi]